MPFGGVGPVAHRLSRVTSRPDSTDRLVVDQKALPRPNHRARNPGALGEAAEAGIDILLPVTKRRNGNNTADLGRGANAASATADTELSVLTQSDGVRRPFAQAVR